MSDPNKPPDPDEEALSWEAYLEYLQKNAKRKALKEAKLASDEEKVARRGSIEGSGTIEVHYTVLSDAPPWTSADLEQYNALSGGGVWETLREDGDGEAGRDADSL